MNAKDAIKAQGRTIAFLAGRLGIERSYLSRQLDGKRPMSRKNAERLAEITGLPVSIFPFTDEREPAEVA